MRKPTLVIAEAGVNHNGDLNVAKRLVDAAAEAGANVVKFQTFSARRLVTQSAPKAEYQERTNPHSQSQLEMLLQLELTPKMHEVLIEHCKRRGIVFLSTAFDIESLDYLATLELARLKIPSGELTNLPYLRRVGSLSKPVILSTGMATLEEIESAIKVLEQTGLCRNQITALHCTTDYPTSMSDVNLMAMCTIRNSLGVAVGYSDHTLGIEVSVAAVALGAVVVEKHLTLNKESPGPDHSASLEPDQFSEMVRAIRNIEHAMGDGIKQPSPGELKNIPIVRKSLVALKPIRAGEMFTSKNLTVKRPGSGISPMHWDEVIGQIARFDFAEDELIKL